MLDEEARQDHETHRKYFNYHIDPSSTSREESQIWNLGLEKPFYPTNLADNFKAYYKYDLIDKLSKQDNKSIKQVPKNNESNMLSLVNQYLKENL